MLNKLYILYNYIVIKYVRSWERLKYDTDAYKYGLKENEKVVNHLINRPKICDPYRQPHPGYIGDVGKYISK